MYCTVLHYTVGCSWYFYSFQAKIFGLIPACCFDANYHSILWLPFWVS